MEAKQLNSDKQEEATTDTNHLSLRTPTPEARPHLPPRRALWRLDGRRLRRCVLSKLAPAAAAAAG